MWRKTYMYRCNKTGSSIPLWLMQTNFNLHARKYRENLQYLYVSIISRHESFNVAGLLSNLNRQKRSSQTSLSNCEISLQIKVGIQVQTTKCHPLECTLKRYRNIFFSLTFRNFFKIHLTILKGVFKHTLVQFFVQSHYSKAIQSIIL